MVCAGAAALAGGGFAAPEGKKEEKALKVAKGRGAMLMKLFLGFLGFWVFVLGLGWAGGV